jgi:hypothetical protein
MELYYYCIENEKKFILANITNRLKTKEELLNFNQINGLENLEKELRKLKSLGGLNVCIVNISIKQYGFILLEEELEKVIKDMFKKIGKLEVEKVNYQIPEVYCEKTFKKINQDGVLKLSHFEINLEKNMPGPIESLTNLINVSKKLELEKNKNI